MAELRLQMPALGWTLSEAYDNIGPQTQRAALIPLLFCNEANESVFVLADGRGADASRSLLRIIVAGDGEGSPCRPRPQPDRPAPLRRDPPRGPERVRAGDRLRLGDLQPPPSSFMASGRCLPATSASSTTLSTELTAEQIVEHYAAQLAAAGWVREESDGPPPSAAAAWQRELDGESFHVVLQAAQHPQLESCFSIHLSSNHDSNRR
jgi:hypothetical protein